MDLETFKRNFREEELAGKFSDKGFEELFIYLSEIYCNEEGEYPFVRTFDAAELCKTYEQITYKEARNRFNIDTELSDPSTAIEEETLCDILENILFSKDLLIVSSEPLIITKKAVLSKQKS